MLVEVRAVVRSAKTELAHLDSGGEQRRVCREEIFEESAELGAVVRRVSVSRRMRGVMDFDATVEGANNVERNVARVFACCPGSGEYADEFEVLRERFPASAREVEYLDVALTDGLELEWAKSLCVVTHGRHSRVYAVDGAGSALVHAAVGEKDSMLDEPLLECVTISV
jgi:hypothetical protein